MNELPGAVAPPPPPPQCPHPPPRPPPPPPGGGAPCPRSPDRAAPPPPCVSPSGGDGDGAYREVNCSMAPTAWVLHLYDNMQNARGGEGRPAASVRMGLPVVLPGPCRRRHVGVCGVVLGP